jgi:hypothetical protein
MKMFKFWKILMNECTYVSGLKSQLVQYYWTLQFYILLRIRGRVGKYVGAFSRRTVNYYYVDHYYARSLLLCTLLLRGMY